MKAGQLGRTLAEADMRYRGDNAPVATTDPRQAQAGFDADRTTMDARLHDELCRCRKCKPGLPPVGVRSGDLARLRVALIAAAVALFIMLCAAGAR